jgi:5,10-methylenetetrahydromethanopterin reductase
MSVGLLLGSSSPPEHIPRLAARAEKLGFAELWLSEDYFTTGGIASAGAALAATSTIPVATGVVSAMARHPAVLAMEASTLARLHPGRFRLGIGLGVRNWLKQMGVDPRSPLTAMREAITAVRALLEGESVTLPGRTHHFDKITLEHPPVPPPPIFAAATAPKMLALSGEITDGTVLSVLSVADYVRWACERIDEGRARRSNESPHQVTTFALCNVSPDPEQARERVRPLAALYLALEPRGPLTDVYGISDELVKIVDNAGGDLSRAAQNMPAEWFEDLVIAGDAAECAAKIQRLLDAGSTTVALFPTPPEESEQIVERLGKDVLPAVPTVAS